MASSSKKNSSPLAALAPLHALAQLVPDTPIDPRSMSGSKHRDKRERGHAYILLTNLEPDAWVIHVGHPDGRWWNGTWRLADVEKLAVWTSTRSPLSTIWVSADKVQYHGAPRAATCRLRVSGPLLSASPARLYNVRWPSHMTGTTFVP